MYHSFIDIENFSFKGSYTDWFKSNPQYILSALNYLIPALSDIELALAAATAFKEICDLCRDSLVNGIEDLVNMYIVVGPNIQVCFLYIFIILTFIFLTIYI